MYIYDNYITSLSLYALDDSNNNTVIIVGVVVAVVVVAAITIVIILILLLVRRRRGNKERVKVFVKVHIDHGSDQNLRYVRTYVCM